jgi:hypothetical protein
MEFLQTHSKEIVSLFVPFLTWLINAKLKTRADLIVGTLHQFSFLVQQPLFDESGQQVRPNQLANTQSIVIKNTGKDTATKIEIVLNFETIVNIWPVRSYEDRKDKDGRYIMIFDNLAPNETIGIELLAINKDLPALITVRSNECIGQNIPMTYYPVIANWKSKALVTLMFAGLASFIYVTIIFIQFLVLKTPIVLGSS